MKDIYEDYLLTIDIDWVLCWMIDYLAKQLIKRRVKATWYVTHNSPAIKAIQQRNDLFEIGIHPNCLAGSTHGSNEDDILKHGIMTLYVLISTRDMVLKHYFLNW